MTEDQLKLQEMFWEYLKDHKPIDSYATATFSEEGVIHTLWEGPGCNYKTRYFEWSIDDPDKTTISMVEYVRVVRWEEETKWSKKYSETNCSRYRDVTDS